MNTPEHSRAPDGMKQRRFLVALSFPGERRDFVAGVAGALGARLGQHKVLYDEFHEAELARLDLDVYLGQLYREESDLLVPFYCVDYDRKKWCKLEWRQMRDILLNLEGHRIMPFRFDDAPVAGVLSLDGYIRIGSRSPQVIADLILQRLGIDEKGASQGPAKTSSQLPLGHASAPPMPSVQEVISGTQRTSPATSSVMPSFYLFASPSGAPEKSSASVFYKVKGLPLAESLCALFKKEYADERGRPGFYHAAAFSISTEEQVLLDEALDWLGKYDDPDPGVYEPEPSKDVLLRAAYASRAETWEALLKQRSHASGPSIGETSEAGPCGADQSPQMPPEDWRNAGLGLLMMLAQVYYRVLECALCSASWFSALDLELNQSYLWTTENITSLLKNHEDLKDFPIPFEPAFPDLYPSTTRDVDWQDMVAPDVERFLSTVQRYVYTKGLHEPEKGSPAWTFIELFRPSANTAIQRAIAYQTRMAKHRERVFGPSGKVTQRDTPAGDKPVGNDRPGTGEAQQESSNVSKKTERSPEP